MIYDNLLTGVIAVTEVETPVLTFFFNLLPLLFLALMIFIFAWLIRFVVNASKEKRRIRMELGRVAEEVRGLREELKNGISTNTSNDNDS